MSYHSIITMNKKTEQSQRIQKSFLNAAEKKALVWMAERLPRWVTSDMMTAVGSIGAFTIALGYALSTRNVAWIWLASLGFVINWVGDSLDGTIARVRNQQRPKYGFFLDHNIDCINEAMMFIGLGLSPMLRMDIALLLLCSYLILSVYVYISAHLKNEFKLTYAKLGPTELRVLAIVLNTVYIYWEGIQQWTCSFRVLGRNVSLSAVDITAIVIMVAICCAYLVNFIRDAREYAAQEPIKKD